MSLSYDSSYVKKAAILFCFIFCTLCSISYLLQRFLVGAPHALPVSFIFSFFFSLFIVSHLKRGFLLECLEINSSNKESHKPLADYYNELIDYLCLLGYEKISAHDDTEHFHPTGRSKLFFGNISIEKTPYYIKVEGPANFIKILISHLGISKIYL